VGKKTYTVYQNSKTEYVTPASTSYQWTTGNSPGSGWTYTGNTRTVNNGSNYAKVGTSSSKSTSANGTYDAYINTTVTSISTYWAVYAQSSGTRPADTSTGSTRQAGPYTAYNYYNELKLEKSVAGTVTQVGSTASIGSSLTQLRLKASGNTLEVYTNGGGSPVITATEAAHNTATKIGLGGGTSDYSPSNPDWDDLQVALL
jgi:hypothetical protein